MNNMNWNGANNYVPASQLGWMPSYLNNQPNTNKVYVTSLEDALSRPASRPSEMVYFHQDANEFYVIKTDMDGRKTWMGFQYSIPNQDANTPATKADLNALLLRIEELEKSKKKEVIENGESNG